jgi:hypothetical protein
MSGREKNMITVEVLLFAIDTQRYVSRNEQRGLRGKKRASMPNVCFMASNGCVSGGLCVRKEFMHDERHSAPFLPGSTCGDVESWGPRSTGPISRT